MRFFTSRGCSRMSYPATVAVPPVGVRKQVSMRMVVVFPAPFGPRNPTIWPCLTSNEIWSTAMVRAYLFVSPFTVIMRILFETDAYELTMVPQSQIYFARDDSKNLACPMSILNIAEQISSGSTRPPPRQMSYGPRKGPRKSIHAHRGSAGHNLHL